MQEEEKDEKIYEIMCKNEKVNLYLKARRKDNWTENLNFFLYTFMLKTVII